MTARLLVVMGSGETSPTMVKTHRDVIAKLPPRPRCVLLDTPFGFQENADDIAARAQAYFASSVRVTVDVASLRSADEATVLERERFVSDVRGADFVFAGPGSPTYALEQWSAVGLGRVLREKMATGGAIVFSSAAALTLGTRSVPVYEIYKAGIRPRWLEGLDVLGATGLSAAVVPHFNNAEGGNHDTRYCYLGERRLSTMERELPPGCFVLGIDEHTCLTLDLETASATVGGIGTVVVRASGRTEALPTGTTLQIAEIAELAIGLSRRSPGSPGSPGSTADPEPVPDGSDTTTSSTASPSPSTGWATQDGPLAGNADASPLSKAISGYQARFDAAMESGDVPSAVAAALDLEDELAAWSNDTLQSDQTDRGRSVLRSMLVVLGRLAEKGSRPVATLVKPYVDLLVGLRDGARSDSRFEQADAIREGLAAAGVQLRDSPEGTAWSVTEAD